jgi:hypothetical protein
VSYGGGGSITKLLALAMMGKLNGIAKDLQGKQLQGKTRRYHKPTLVKKERESRQVRRAHERRAAKGGET